MGSILLDGWLVKGETEVPGADLILKNANIITIDPLKPFARLVAIGNGRIVFVGADDQQGAWQGAGTKVIDCGGKTLVPGFNDAHCHIHSFLRKLLSLDLSPPAVKSIYDIQAVLKRKADKAPPSQWIVGTDYNDFYLAEKRHPTRWDIDEFTPDHPVILSHRSLHACVLNSRALALAGINRETWIAIRDAGFYPSKSITASLLRRPRQGSQVSR
jgi:predicted amidohydrolase YtcJ